MLLIWARPWPLFGPGATQGSLTPPLYRGPQSVEESPAASNPTRWHPENRTEQLYPSEAGGKSAGPYALPSGRETR